MPKNNKSYWAKRMKIAQDKILNRVQREYSANLEKQYDHAIRQIEKDIARWYQRFADNNEISLADARKLLNSEELKEFKWTVDDYIKHGKENAISGEWTKELENASARVHISRLQSLETELRQHAEELTGKQLNTVKAASEFAYSESYNHTAFELGQNYGINTSFQKIDKRKLDVVLNQPWTADNKTFTARCWNNKDKLVRTVNQELTRMVATGEAPEKVIKRIADTFGVAKKNAARLVLTESAAVSSMAQEKCFKDLDVEEFEFVGTLDGRTCDICGKLDGQHFPMKEWEIGVTVPPMHPFCRCCTVPYDADFRGKRAARDENGKSVLVDDMTYEEWKNGKKNVETSLEIHTKATDTKVAKAKDIVDNTKDTNIRWSKDVWQSWDDYRAKYLGHAVDISTVDIDNNALFQTVDLTKLSQKSANNVMNTINSLNDKYYSPLSKVVVMDKQETLTNHAFASTVHYWGVGTAEIRINPIRLNESGLQKVFELGQKGYFGKIPKGKEMEYIITHEYGHSILNIGESLPSKSKNFVLADFEPVKKARKEVEKIFADYASEVKKYTDEYDTIKKPIETKMLFGTGDVTEAERQLISDARSKISKTKISEYSLSSTDEFVAEAFADVEFNGNDASDYSKKVHAVIVKYFGR